MSYHDLHSWCPRISVPWASKTPQLPTENDPEINSTNWRQLIFVIRRFYYYYFWTFWPYFVPYFGPYFSTVLLDRTFLRYFWTVLLDFLTVLLDRTRTEVSKKHKTKKQKKISSTWQLATPTGWNGEPSSFADTNYANRDITKWYHPDLIKLSL